MQNEECHIRMQDELDGCPSEILEPVYLNVYNIASLNCLLNLFGLGVYHTGIEVYSKEFWFGGHEGKSSGIVLQKPGQIGIPLKEKIFLGLTRMAPQEIGKEKILLDRIWVGCSYDPFTRNCNHFAKTFSMRILGYKFFPEYINRFVALRPIIKAWFRPCQMICGDLIKEEVKLTNAPRKRIPARKLHSEKLTRDQISPDIGSSKSYSTAPNPRILQIETGLVKANQYFKEKQINMARGIYLNCLDLLKRESTSYIKIALNTKLCLKLANCCNEMDLLEQGEAYCNKCLQLNDNCAKAYVKRAQFRRKLNILQAAQRDIERAISIDPNYLVAKQERELILMSLEPINSPEHL